jgi:multidrug resistance protein, MATE family
VKVSISNKDIIRLAAPISLSILIPQISFLTNTAFLGRMGEMELGVNGITGIFYLTLSMIGYGLSSGIQVQMARRAGEGDKDRLAKTFTNGITLSLLVSLGLILLSLWLAPLIFGLNLHNARTTVLSIGFLYIRVWGLPFLMLTQLANSFYISVGKSRFLIYGSLAGTITNILFDYLLIFGKMGFPQMGLEGAAIASIISEVVYCMVMFGLYYFHKLHLTYPLLSNLRFDVALSKKSLMVAVPLIVQFLFSIGGWQVFFIFVEHLGTRELAASQILRSVFGIVSVGTWALASTCNVMVSNVIGQGKQRMVLPVISKIAKLSLVYVCILAVVLFLFSDTFLSLYRDDASLVAFSTPSLRVILSATFLMALSTVMFNGVVGTGNTMVNLAIEITCVLSYLVYCYIVIERMRLPLHWAWGSEFVYWGSLFTTSYLYLRSGKWKGKKI